MRARIAFAVALIASSRIAAGATLHVDTFDSGVQGWTGGFEPQFVAAGGAGDGGGFILVTPASKFATYNFGTAWVSNYQEIGADRVKVDMMAPLDSASPLEMRLVLFGLTSTSERWTSSAAQTVPNDGVWRKYTFLINPTALTHVLGTATYEQMAAGVVRVMLRHDPDAPDSGGTPVDAKLGIDNVELATAPPPPTPGDFDGDGDVDGSDLTGAPLGFTTRFGGDLSGNDFLDWQRNLGAPLRVSAAGVVPEPITSRLFGLAAAALGIRRCIKIASTTTTLPTHGNHDRRAVLPRHFSTGPVGVKSPSASRPRRSPARRRAVGRRARAPA